MARRFGGKQQPPVASSVSQPTASPNKEPTFDANERIAGFSMVAIKRAITHVGLMDDRDDIETVARELKCSRGQAERVLVEFERRDLVTKAKKKNQWETTSKGNFLSFHWHPPRRFTPAIDRESGTATNLGLEEVPCSIWRATDDDEDMFEEALLEVGMFAEYDHERLIEINVSQPDEYQGESAGSGLIETSVYLSPADAKRFVAGLQEAIEKSEAELARRKKKDDRKRLRANAKTARTSEEAPEKVKTS